MKNNYIEQKISNTLEHNFMPYAMSVIVSRAIVEIDGFKPSHRKLLYTMYQMGLLNGPRTKSANVVGQTMKLNPHGDMAIYETMVRLTKGNEALLMPFIDSKGNFGKQYSKDMRFAAPRYTEVKLEKVSEEIFRDLDKDAVDFVDNYDGTMKEPLLLPTTFPNILVSPNQGIAVGMASNICSFNLVEVCNAAIEYMKNPKTDMVSHIKAPDFSTGGQLIYNRDDMAAIYETGRGSFRVRAKYRVDKKNNCIDIYEIPYTTTIEAIIDSVTALVKSGKIRDITDVRDETDLKGLKITLDLKRNTDGEELMGKLYKLTPLEDSFSCNFNILVNGTPRVMGIREILKEWVEFRVGCIKRIITHELDKKKRKLHLLEGLEKILLDIDKAIRIVRGTEEDSQVVPNLMKAFSIDEVQAEFVAEIKLRNLNKRYILDRIDEISSLKDEIGQLTDTLGSEKKINRVIADQLRAVAKKHGMERKTSIISEDKIEEVTHEDFIEDYNVKIFLTDHNYLKKIPLMSLRANPDQKLKEEDDILMEVDGRNKDELLLFSDKCNVYKLKVYEVEDHKASVFGEYLSNLLGLEDNEKIVYMAVTTDYSGCMLFAFENGKVAKINMGAYETKTNRKKLVNAYYKGSPLCGALFLNEGEDKDLLVTSDIGKVILFDSKLINVKTTRSSQGVQVLRQRKGSKLTALMLKEDGLLIDPEYYRIRKIPAVGYYIKKEESKKDQLRLNIDL